MNIKVDVNVNLSLSKETLEALSDLFTGIARLKALEGPAGPLVSSTEKKGRTKKTTEAVVLSGNPSSVLETVAKNEDADVLSGSVSANEPAPATTPKPDAPVVSIADVTAAGPIVANSGSAIINAASDEVGIKARQDERRAVVKSLRDKDARYGPRIIEIVKTYKVTNLSDIPDESHEEFLLRVNAIKL